MISSGANSYVAGPAYGNQGQLSFGIIPRPQGLLTPAGQEQLQRAQMLKQMGELLNALGNLFGGFGSFIGGEASGTPSNPGSFPLGGRFPSPFPGSFPLGGGFPSPFPGSFPLGGGFPSPFPGSFPLGGGFPSPVPGSFPLGGGFPSPFPGGAPSGNYPLGGGPARPTYPSGGSQVGGTPSGGGYDQPGTPSTLPETVTNWPTNPRPLGYKPPNFILEAIAQQNQRRNDASAAREVLGAFGTRDRNGDGVISENELNLLAQTHPSPEVRDSLGRIAAAIPELMFLSIDAGNAAWHGISEKDLMNLVRRLENGESLEQIQAQTRTKVIKDRGIPHNPYTTTEAEAFRDYVEQQRQRVRQPASPLSYTPGPAANRPYIPAKSPLRFFV